MGGTYIISDICNTVAEYHNEAFSLPFSRYRTSCSCAALVAQPTSLTVRLLCAKNPLIWYSSPYVFEVQVPKTFI